MGKAFKHGCIRETVCTIRLGKSITRGIGSAWSFDCYLLYFIFTSLPHFLLQPGYFLIKCIELELGETPQRGKTEKRQKKGQRPEVNWEKEVRRRWRRSVATVLAVGRLEWGGVTSQAESPLSEENLFQKKTNNSNNQKEVDTISTVW